MTICRELGLKIAQSYLKLRKLHPKATATPVAGTEIFYRALALCEVQPSKNHFALVSF